MPMARSRSVPTFAINNHDLRRSVIGILHRHAVHDCSNTINAVSRNSVIAEQATPGQHKRKLGHGASCACVHPLDSSQHASAAITDDAKKATETSRRHGGRLQVPVAEHGRGRRPEREPATAAALLSTNARVASRQWLDAVRA